MDTYPVMCGALSNRLDVRLTKDEALALREKCIKLQMSKSDFVRLCIAAPIGVFGAENSENSTNSNRVLVVDKDSLNRLLVECKRWGNNYNQGVRALNFIGSKYKAAAQSSDFAKEVMGNSAQALEKLNAAHIGINEVLKFIEELKQSTSSVASL